MSSRGFIKVGYFFFYCQEIISIKLNRKLEVKMQQTVNLILPWWELINISTGILMHYLNCTRSLGKLPFLKFSNYCHLVSGVQVRHFINLLISYRGDSSLTQSRLKYQRSNNYFYGCSDLRGSWRCEWLCRQGQAEVLRVWAVSPVLLAIIAAPERAGQSSGTGTLVCFQWRHLG